MCSSARRFQNQQLSQHCVSINVETAHSETVKTKMPDVNFVQTPIYRNKVFFSTHTRRYLGQLKKCIFHKTAMEIFFHDTGHMMHLSVGTGSRGHEQ